MGFNLKDGIAMLMAIPFLVILNSMAQAQDLTLPHVSADPVVLHLEGVVPDQEMLRVFVEGAATPIAGRYTIADDSLQFAPAFGFEPGQAYVAQILKDGEIEAVGFRLSVADTSVRAAVTEIYPSGDSLPENTLRFYIHFSTPMQPHVAFDHIRLLDGSGNVDEAAFMRFKQELWNEDRTRLTVLIDPGRIKRNVATNVELGPALLEGQTYILTIDAGWPSADGESVLPGFEKRFTVTAPLRELPDVGLWQLKAPCVDTHEPLHIEFDRPFDRHLLVRDIRVRTEEGRNIAGKISVGKSERSWGFTPDAPWSKDRIQVRVSSTLEDVSANNFRDLLDHEASDAPYSGSITLPISLPACTD